MHVGDNLPYEVVGEQLCGLLHGELHHSHTVADGVGTLPRDRASTTSWIAGGDACDTEPSGRGHTGRCSPHRRCWDPLEWDVTCLRCSIHYAESNTSTQLDA